MADEDNGTLGRPSRDAARLLKVSSETKHDISNLPEKTMIATPVIEDPRETANLSAIAKSMSGQESSLEKPKSDTNVNKESTHTAEERPGNKGSSSTSEVTEGSKNSTSEVKVLRSCIKIQAIL